MLMCEIWHSLIAALPRMAWALYGGGRPGFLNRAVRPHVSFDLETQASADLRVPPAATANEPNGKK